MQRLIYTLPFGVFFVSCGGVQPPQPPQPSPTPISSPSPTPPPATALTPLRVQGTQFVNASGVVKFMGPEGCCEQSKSNGWPWVNEKFMLEAKAHGATVVFLRLGPFTREGERPAPMFVGDPTLYNFEAYIRLAHPTPGYHSMYDPRDGWAAGYWERLRKILTIARSIGLYVCIDVADAWVLRNNRWHTIEGVMVNDLSPWESAEPSIKLSTPRTWHKAWVQKVALETGSYANVFYSIGNEAFAPAGKVGPAWELGIRDIIRGIEQERGFARHLIGTNSMLAEIEKQVDYVIEHGPWLNAQGKPDAPRPRWGKPLVNFETSDKLDAKTWAAVARQARARGSEAMLWRGDLLDADWQWALDEMAKIQGE